MAIKSSFGNRFGSVFGSRFFNAFEAASPPPLVLDPDAANYIDAVETADGQSLELAVKVAYNNFILGCKSDGIWTAIKASCILAGARTLNGALIPLVGTAPTNFNFVDGDYNRKTGLLGDGSTKYLDSNRNNTADPQNSKHISVFPTSILNQGSLMNTGSSGTGRSGIFVRPGVPDALTSCHNQFGFDVSTVVLNPLDTYKLMGLSRNNDSNYTARFSGANSIISSFSYPPNNADIFIFARPRLPADSFANARLSFYSIGESLDLIKLDSRVTQLVADIGNAIP